MDFTAKPAADTAQTTTPMNAQEMYGPKKRPVTDEASRKLDLMDQKKGIDSNLARLYSEAGNSPAKIQQIADLQSTRAGLTLQERPKVTAPSAQDVQKATPYTQIGDSGFYKGPEAPVGPPTKQDVDSAAPYHREGTSGFFKEPAEHASTPAITSSPTAQVAIPPIDKGTVATAEPPAIDKAMPISEKSAQAIVEQNPGFDWAGAAKKFGVGILELVNAFALGEAGVTNPDELATTKRLAREDEATKLQAQKDQAAKELDASTKKDELDRQYQAEQNRIQNQFTIDRDATKAEADKAAAEKDYQYKLGEIGAQNKSEAAKTSGSAKAPSWVQNAVAVMKQRQASSKPAEGKK